jgi:hypothetical protein
MEVWSSRDEVDEVEARAVAILLHIWRIERDKAGAMENPEAPLKYLEAEIESKRQELINLAKNK